MKKLALFLVAASCLCACVTQEKYNEAKESEARYYDEARKCNEKLSDCEVRNNELQAEIKRLKALKDKAEADTAKLAKELKRVQADCEAMQEQNRELFDKLQVSKSQEEVQALMAEIQDLQSELMRREDALFQAERDLADKQKELELKNARINELNDLLSSQERKIAEIKETIKNALVGYEGNGLQVTTKNGRIYVSMDERLLFQSGKWDVNARGADALQKLAAALADQKDIDIVVEGHTDNIPYGGNGNILDNWDLSVKRATAITRILLSSGQLDATRISASGRAEFCPVDNSDTTEGRAKNRRCEIILNPNLDQLLKLFE